MAGKSATDFDKRLGERIAAFRTASGLAQREVAEALGVSAAQLQKYEKGSNCLKVNTLPVLAGLFGRRIEEFFGAEMHEMAVAPPAGEGTSTVAAAADKLARTVGRMEQAVCVVKSALAETGRPMKRSEQAEPAPPIKRRAKPQANGAATDA